MYCGENDIISAGRVLQLFAEQAIKYTVDRIYPEAALYTLSKSEVLGVVQQLKFQAMDSSSDYSDSESD